jgi:hypothetical protein
MSFDQLARLGDGLLHLVDALVLMFTCVTVVRTFCDAWTTATVAKYRGQKEEGSPLLPAPPTANTFTVKFAPLFHSYTIGRDLYFCNGTAIDPNITYMTGVQVNGVRIEKGSVHALASQEYFNSMPGEIRDSYLDQLKSVTVPVFFYRISPL